jgi:hypothetical protein
VGDRVDVIYNVENLGSVPIYSTFIMGKLLGHVGTIDYLSPGSSHSIESEIVFSGEIDDLITAEGFIRNRTSERWLSVRDSCDLHIIPHKPIVAESHSEEVESSRSSPVEPPSSDGPSVSDHLTDPIVESSCTGREAEDSSLVATPSKDPSSADQSLIDPLTTENTSVDPLHDNSSADPFSVDYTSSSNKTEASTYKPDSTLEEYEDGNEATSSSSDVQGTLDLTDVSHDDAAERDNSEEGVQEEVDLGRGLPDQTEEINSDGLTGLLERLRAMLESIRLRKSDSLETNDASANSTESMSHVSEQPNSSASPIADLSPGLEASSSTNSPTSSTATSITDVTSNPISSPGYDKLSNGSSSVSSGARELSITEAPRDDTLAYSSHSTLQSPRDMGSSQLFAPLSDSFDGLVPSAGSVKLTIEEARPQADGPPQIIDVAAFPAEPIDGSPVVVSVHASDDWGLDSVTLLWSIASVSVVQPDLLEVGRMNTLQMTPEGGTSQEGYWSCQIPGQPAGTYMSLTVRASDGVRWAEDGPYLLYWSAKSSAPETAPVLEEPEETAVRDDKDGMFYVESTTVVGTGEVSIKDEFRESTVRFKEKMDGYGSIEMASQRVFSSGNPQVNFSDSTVLTFDQGQLKGFKRLESPSFHGGMGASISESFNTNTLEKCEVGMIRSVNRSENTLSLDTQQAFEGAWGTKTVYSKFGKKMKTDQLLNGTFETKKKITFED